MKAWLADIGAVWLRGAKFIIGGGVLSILGYAKSGVHVLHHGGRWYWPSPLWWLFLVAGIVIAQQLVIRDRRGKTARTPSSLRAMLSTATRMVDRGAQVQSISHTDEAGATSEIRFAAGQEPDVSGLSLAERSEAAE